MKNYCTGSHTWNRSHSAGHNIFLTLIFLNKKNMTAKQSHFKNIKNTESYMAGWPSLIHVCGSDIDIIV